MHKAWIQLLRLPNLPTVPGDVIAGATIAALARGGANPSMAQTPQLLAACAASVALYAGGLIDNDLVDAARDATDAPSRPIPSGAVSATAARRLRAGCFIFAFACGAIAGLSHAWFACAALLCATIFTYNRAKRRFRLVAAPLMGACRGLNVLCAILIDGCSALTAGALPVLAGWTLYVAGVTKLAENEHRAKDPLGPARYVPALFALIPALAVFADGFAISRAIAISAGCGFAAYAWCKAVAPLGAMHDAKTRGAAVGAGIGALLYLQTGFAACAPDLTAPIIMAMCFASRTLIRKTHPSITGS